MLFLRLDSPLWFGKCQDIFNVTADFVLLTWNKNIRFKLIKAIVMHNLYNIIRELYVVTFLWFILKNIVQELKVSEIFIIKFHLVFTNFCDNNGTSQRSMSVILSCNYDSNMNYDVII